MFPFCKGCDRLSGKKQRLLACVSTVIIRIFVRALGGTTDITCEKCKKKNRSSWLGNVVRAEESNKVFKIDSPDRWLCHHSVER